MGTFCSTQQQKKVQFTAYFTANLRQLFEYYKTLLEFLKPSNLFAASSEELILLVDTYLDDPKAFPKENLGLCSLDSVNKLHPLSYGTDKVTKQWLIDACVRQNKFIQDFPYQLLNFEECYKHYVEFVYLCFKNPESIIVPNKMADFMWHSHMQDNFRYQKDMVKMIGKVLDHFDDMNPQQMEEHTRKTEQARKRLLKVPQRKGVVAPNGSSSQSVSYHQYGFINYGPEFCGGAIPNPYPDIDPHPHHHHHSHHTQDKHNDHHHDHNQSNNYQPHESHNNHNHDTSSHGHNDANNHSSCGGGGHSSCGGGGHSSSGGGGASSCGGGGSSCGGGCGGGGGD